MRRLGARLAAGPALLFAWAAYLVVIGFVSLLFPTSASTRLLLAELIAGTLAIGAADLWLRRRGEPSPRAPEAVPSASPPAALLALGLTALLIGVEAGPWLELIGAATLAIAAAGLVRELRCERAALAAAREEEE